VQVSGDVLSGLSDHMVLIHTGIARRATQTVAEQIEATKTRAIDEDLSHLYNLVGECADMLENPGNDFLPAIGKMLSESWHVKRRLSSSISNSAINELFEVIERSGAYGAKLCGAGGGGFFMALISPDRLPALRDAIAPLAVIPIGIDVHGTTLIYPATGPNL